MDDEEEHQKLLGGVENGHHTGNGVTEKSPLLGPGAQYSPVGVPSTVLEPPNVYKNRWRSIRIMYLTTFLASVSFSICVSSIWPYLKEMSPGVTTTFLGWVLAAYSLGQLAASPVFGLVANTFRSSRAPLLVSLALRLAANTLYAFVADMHDDRRYYLLLARTVIGVGAGGVTVCRSYVAGATTLKERMGVMANISAVQSVGFIIGPVIQAAFTPMGYPGPLSVPGFHLNMYTGPSFLTILLIIVNFLLLILVFQEHTVHDDLDSQTSRMRTADTRSLQSPDEPKPIPPDYAAAATIISLFFVILLIFSVFETIGTPLVQNMLGWTNKQATFYVGLGLATLGALAIGIVLIVKALAKRFNERVLLVVGFSFVVVGFVAYLPWGHHHPPVPWSHEVAVLNVSTTTSAHNASTAIIASTTTAGPAGCVYSWCFTVPKIYLWQIILSNLLIGTGFPMVNVTLFTLYSKLLGPAPQGTMMGILTGAGSLARALGPIVITNVYDHYGPRVSFLMIIGVAVLAIVATLLIYRRLVPYPVYRDKVRRQQMSRGIN